MVLAQQQVPPAKKKHKPAVTQPRKNTNNEIAKTDIKSIKAALQTKKRIQIKPKFQPVNNSAYRSKKEG
jgi:hypothetical protein